ncbi:MAG: response regulator, partial [Bacteroidota bacterium]
DNFFHERVIRKNNAAEIVLTKTTGTEALKYLKSMNANGDPLPALIFLDINMPGMNGWEFIEEYEKLDKGSLGRVIIIMLTTSENPDDKMKSMKLSVVSDFRTKPLTKETLEEIMVKFF